MFRHHSSMWASFLMFVLNVCHIMQLGFASSSLIDNNQNALETNQTRNCWQDVNICKRQNQTCNFITGFCDCPPSKPIRLSSEIPCSRAKLLGQVCLHTRECSTVQNAACFATILFPVELLSVPTYRQWYIYSQITESDELKFLLNKVYGECRCKAGFRATHPNKCVPKENDTGRDCFNQTECTLSHSHCDSHAARCQCSIGFFYDQDKSSCIELDDRYEQFCVISSDCQAKDRSLQCLKSRCVCESGYNFVNGSTCMPSTECASDRVWNKSSSLCESSSSLFFHSILVKIVLILLLKLIICNLVRIVCLRRHTLNTQELRTHYLDNHDGQGGQSRSLLSLPPYETVFSETTSVTVPQADYLPTYEEALESVQNVRGYQVLNADKESEIV